MSINVLVFLNTEKKSEVKNFNFGLLLLLHFLWHEMQNKLIFCNRLWGMLVGNIALSMTFGQ